MTSKPGVDPNILALLPSLGEILEVKDLPGSRWARISHIRVSLGHHGWEAIKGEFNATSAIYAATPDFCPHPIAWGRLKTERDAHFYICKYHHFSDAMPEPTLLSEKLARLHSSHTSPNGKFGFHCATYNGDIPQDNTWSNIWEAFANGLRQVLSVTPRLLRPLETNGRKIRPSLVHGDLWFGNCAVKHGSGEVLVFDPAGFYGHNEYELGNWRPGRNRFRDGGYFEAYHSRMPPSERVEEYDDKNALYALKFDLHAATLFPNKAEFLQMAIDEIRRLTTKYPDGYTGDE
ncbi:Fructosamine kinase-domain-containing protein [Corynascus novoguineensis]|uniref:protein-ribulosamine 3-kinase n=1 Tax=Corynascus novoguineensis TaxID=1126955 RepID=A0AAN7CTZ5_9PEZI|nr:Fructosamine kinase-domain-containing protein [Corynascus novoguineensis]